MDPITMAAAAGAVLLWNALKQRNKPSVSHPPSPPPKVRKNRIAFVGKTNSGKSSLANAIFATNFGTGPTHGITQTVESQYVAFDNGLWQVVDTPGILDTRDYSETVLNAVEESKLTVFVITGQLYNDELNFLKRVRARSFGMGGLIIFINKEDVRRTSHTSQEMELENKLIIDQVQSVSRLPIPRFFNSEPLHVTFPPLAIPPSLVIFGSASPKHGCPEVAELQSIIRNFINRN